MKAIRDRIITIIKNELSALTNDGFSVAEFVPIALSDLYGYTIIVRPNSASVKKTSSSMLEDTQVWTVSVYSPQVNTNLRNNQEDNILDYGNNLVELLIKKDRLQYNGANLTGVKGSQVTGWELIAPSEFAGVNHYTFIVSLTIQYSRSHLC